MGSRLGAEKSAATKVGCTVETYRLKVADGLRWCTGCKAWRLKERFNADASRSDGLGRSCRRCQNKRGHELFLIKGNSRGR